MLERVEVVTSQGAVLNLPLGDISSNLQITSIDGLDPVKVSIASSSFAQLDGAQYQSSRRETRNIKLQISLRPDYNGSTVRSLRQELYQYFMPKTEVNLGFFMLDENGVRATGRVESFETALFTKDPAVDISIICFDPDFYDPAPEVMSGMSTADDEEEIDLFYAGSVDTGIVINLSPGRDVNEFTLYNRPSNGRLQMLNFVGDLMASDSLEISTVPGNKYLTRDGQLNAGSMLYAVSPQSNWIKLVPGMNHIRLYSEGSEFPYTLTYMNRYGGL